MTGQDQDDWILAIDGPAGAGKSSVARKVAALLGYSYLDTGAMYRAVTLACLRAGLREEPLDADRVAEVVTRVDLRLDVDGSVRLGAEDVRAELRTEGVTALVSAVSALPVVRRKMVELQRQAAAQFAVRGHGLVVDGRDIGSHVFPGARHRFYLDASLEERARRRQAQEKGTAPLEEWQRRIAERDRKDSQRALAPLTVAPGAVVLDTTTMTEDEVVEAIVARVKH